MLKIKKRFFSGKLIGSIGISAMIIGILTIVRVTGIYSPSEIMGDNAITSYGQGQPSPDVPISSKANGQHENKEKPSSPDSNETRNIKQTPIGHSSSSKAANESSATSSFSLPLRTISSEVIPLTPTSTATLSLVPAPSTISSSAPANTVQANENTAPLPVSSSNSTSVPLQENTSVKTTTTQPCSGLSILGLCVLSGLL